MAVSRLLGPVVLVVSVLIVAVTTLNRVPRQERWVNNWLDEYHVTAAPLTYEESIVLDPISRHALDRSKAKVVYDPSYVPIAYPGGDVPHDKGVCTDEVIRVLRKVGIDLQRAVHEDKVVHLRDYPFLWFQFRADPNIDHRRVPNLMTFMKRKGVTLPLSLSSP